MKNLRSMNQPRAPAHSPQIVDMLRCDVAAWSSHERKSRNPTEENKQLMNANTNADSTAYTRLIDDLLWLHARGHSNDGLREAVDAMIAEYTANPDQYSDGSPIGAQYIPDYAPNVIAWEPFPPPHRRTTETDT
jgi:hypothetical protein